MTKRQLERVLREVFDSGVMAGEDLCAIKREDFREYRKEIVAQACTAIRLPPSEVARYFGAAK